MSRRNQAKRRRNYGRRQHEVRERRGTDAAEEGEAGTRDEAWGDWTTSDVAQDQHTPENGSYGSYAR